MYIKEKGKYKISLLGEFIDKSMEDEFLAESLSGSAKRTSYVALIFGFILTLFLIEGCFAADKPPLFLNIIIIRLIFIFTSMIVFLITKKVEKHRNLIYINTLYQAIMAAIYLFTLKQYDSLSFFGVQGLMVITMAIYLLPNKIIISQLIAVLFSVLFFVDPINEIEGLKIHEFYRVIAYQIIVLTYCSINNCWSESNKRKRYAANKELLELSSKDPLTGIYNRAKFDDTMDMWISYSERYGSPFSIILFDIDDFKGINDNYGHLAGDKVAKKIASTINKSIRDTDIFARWGGDEFVILLPNTDIQQAEEIAERMRICISNNLYEPVKNITCSFGVAVYEKNDTTQSLLNKADKLLLQAKAAGKDRVVSM